MASSSTGYCYPSDDGYGASSSPPPSFQSLLMRGNRFLNSYLDRTTLYLKTRWLVFFMLLVVYIWRVWWLQGFFVVTYGLGIYLLNLLIGFISPQVDPETDELVLPVTNETGEYRPFQRQLLEFKCWTGGLRAVLLSLLMTCFSIFDLPVFWPILLIYFLLLFFLTMKQQIKRMIKYRYLPFSWGKQTYGDITRSRPTAGSNNHHTNPSKTNMMASHPPTAPGSAMTTNTTTAGEGGGLGVGNTPALAATKTFTGGRYLKPGTQHFQQQQQQQRNGYYYPRNGASEATGAATATPLSLSTTTTPASPPPGVLAASNTTTTITQQTPPTSSGGGGGGAGGGVVVAASSFTAADHFTTPYVLR